jgi:membrane-associated phospholipid phosphatase
VEWLLQFDRRSFIFINQTLANPVFDAVMPSLTDWNKSWLGLALFGALWLSLLLAGGRNGRTVALLLIPLIYMSDQLSSTLVKSLVARPRPCHVIDGMQVFDHLRLLVPCGSGFSFPSSHATNNIAFATFLSYYYRRWSWLLFFYAFLMCLSRVVVGVHYPLDVAGGTVLGALCAAVIISLWNLVGRTFPGLDIRGHLRHEPLAHPAAPHDPEN